jgi:hypothetical protein
MKRSVLPNRMELQDEIAVVQKYQIGTFAAAQGQCLEHLEM